MLFAAIVISYFTFKFLPWWGVFLMFAALGAWRGGKWKGDLLIALISGLVFAAMTFWADGKTGALVSQRMSGMFGLPKQELIFVVMFVMQFISSTLALQAGSALRGLFARQTV